MSSLAETNSSSSKDQVFFVTKEDHATPSTVQLPPSEQSPGLILESGEINWNCPCLGGMATGPCGVEFRDAFSCFHYSEESPKGSECFETFKTMQDCFSKYPDVYDKGGASGGAAGDDEADLDAALAESESTAETVSNAESAVDPPQPTAAAAAAAAN